MGLRGATKETGERTSMLVDQGYSGTSLRHHPRVACNMYACAHNVLEAIIHYRDGVTLPPDYVHENIATSIFTRPRGAKEFKESKDATGYIDQYS